MTSKKHYIEVARLIKDELEQAQGVGFRSERSEAQADTLQTVAEGLARIYARENDRFDRSRFLTACGFKG